MDVLVTVLFSVGGIIVGAVVTILLAKKYRSRKELSVCLVSFDSTFSITEWIKDKITIRYKNKKVESLSRLRLILQNTGNKGIRKEDIVEPIRISLPDSESFIEICKHSSNFENYSIVQVSPNILEFQFDLMNPGDVIAVELLTTQDKLGSLFVEGRGTELKFKWQETMEIVGGIEKKNRNALVKTSISILISLFALVPLVVALDFLWYVSDIFDLRYKPILIIFMCIILLIFLFEIAFVSWLISFTLRLRKRKKLRQHYEELLE